MKVYCIGIGGIGVSGVARFLKHEGHDVSGSDLDRSAITDGLSGDGISVYFDQSGEHLTKDTDVVVYSIAIADDHPELMKAWNLGIPTYTYANVLGELSRNKKTIAISGTHGKTTAAGMLYSVFLSNKKSPSALVGSLMKDFGGINIACGSDDDLILEACEYRRNFASLHPAYALVINIEFDHCDFFQTEDHYFRAFKSFLSKVPPKGFIVMRTEDSVKVGADYFQCKVVFYDQYIDELKNRASFNPKVFGEHNLQNAACAYAFAKELGFPEEKILRGLENYSGTWRRMEYKGGIKGAEIYDDYAHHPSEVKATLSALREKYPNKKIRAVFQPHQYSRTKFFLDEFAKSFDDADEVIVSDIYRVRDTDAAVSTISIDDLVSEISEHHQNVRNGEGIKNTAKYINETSAEDDVVVTMGAGDITKIHTKLDFSL
jgi:UDP-N-acetylmuramate--alanine ligase